MLYLFWSAGEMHFIDTITMFAIASYSWPLTVDFIPDKDILRSVSFLLNATGIS